MIFKQACVFSYICVASKQAITVVEVIKFICHHHILLHRWKLPAVLEQWNVIFKANVSNL